MVRWTRKRLDELAGERLRGFIFKGGSPSSGMERVRVYNEKGVPGKNGTGLFAGMFMKRFSGCRWRRKAAFTTLG